MDIRHHAQFSLGERLNGYPCFPERDATFLRIRTWVTLPWYDANLFLLCLRVSFSSKGRDALIIEILKIFRFPILI